MLKLNCDGTSRVLTSDTFKKKVINAFKNL